MGDPSTEAFHAAFQDFAEREMPWLLEKPEDDAERLLRTTALISFARGYQAGQQAPGPLGPDAPPVSARASCRETLQPHLVRQLCGLRRHQVEDAIGLLLDYIDASIDSAAQPGNLK